MDRALWKAKDIEYEKWVTGYYFKSMTDADIIEEEIVSRTPHKLRGTMFNINKRHVIDPSTLCQCTGLKDKNGVLIFEGDKINVMFNPRYVERISWKGEPDAIGTVVYDLYAFRFKAEGEEDKRYGDFYDLLDNYQGRYNLHDVSFRHCEVIGNIHD